jgi:hypothetical protein
MASHTRAGCTKPTQALELSAAIADVRHHVLPGGIGCDTAKRIDEVVRGFVRCEVCKPGSST